MFVLILQHNIPFWPSNKLVVWIRFTLFFLSTILIHLPLTVYSFELSFSYEMQLEFLKNYPITVWKYKINTSNKISHVSQMSIEESVTKLSVKVAGDSQNEATNSRFETRNVWPALCQTRGSSTPGDSRTYTLRSETILG